MGTLLFQGGITTQFQTASAQAIPSDGAFLNVLIVVCLFIVVGFVMTGMKR